jgi:hypothetical protein
MKRIVFLIFLVPLFTYSQTFKEKVEPILTKQNSKMLDTDFGNKQNLKKVEIIDYGGGLSNFDKMDSISKANYITSIATIDYNDAGDVINYHKNYISFYEGARFDYDSKNRLKKIIRSKGNKWEEEPQQNEVIVYTDSIITRKFSYGDDDDGGNHYISKYFINKQKLIYKEYNDENYSRISEYKYNKNRQLISTNDNEDVNTYDRYKNLIRTDLFRDGKSVPFLSHRYKYNSKRQLIRKEQFQQGKLKRATQYEYKNGLVSKETVFSDGKEEYSYVYQYDNTGNWIRRDSYRYEWNTKRRGDYSWVFEVTVRKITYK